MSTRDAFRVAPSRGGLRAAEPWRFWRRGAEFYAASRGAIQSSKLSFHRTKWQLSVGPAVQQLTHGRFITPDWRHVVSLEWLLWPGALSPFASREERVSLIEVPDDHKLAVNLLLSVNNTDTPPPIVREGGAFVWEQRLRDRRTILLHAVTLPQSELDRGIAARLRREATLDVERMPAPGETYAEIAWFSARAEGNVVAIAPLGPDAFRVREGRAT